MTEVDKRSFSGNFKVVICTRRAVKMKEHLPFFRESAHLVFKIELLLTMLPRFERQAFLKAQHFDE